MGVNEVIVATVSQTLGVTVDTSNTIGVDCSITAPPCTTQRVEGTLTVWSGRMAEVTVELISAGEWTGGADCPIDGHPWTDLPCGRRIETGNATLVGQGTCNNLGGLACR